MDPSSLLAEFRAEVSDHLATLDSELLQLESDPSDPEPLRRMFLSAHTIKGDAAMVGLVVIRDLAHAMEDVLAFLRDRRAQLNPGTADLLFRAMDELRRLVEAQDLEATERAESIAVLGAALRQAASPGAQTSLSHPAPQPSPAAPLARDSKSADRMASGHGAGASLFPSTAAESRSAHPRALLVERSATARTLEAMELSDAGFQVDAIATGEEALTRASEVGYDLVVTGIETGEVRGFDLVATLRRSSSGDSVAAIIVSSDDNAMNRARAAELGAMYLLRGGAHEGWLLDAARRVLSGG